MSEATDTDQTFTESEVRRRETAARRRGYLIGGGLVAVTAALIALLIWPLVDSAIYLRDDRGLGEQFRTHMHPDDRACTGIAEALYDHGLFVLDSGSYDNEGWAPRSEKAFYEGCTGDEVFRVLHNDGD